MPEAGWIAMKSTPVLLPAPGSGPGPTDNNGRLLGMLTGRAGDLPLMLVHHASPESCVPLGGSTVPRSIPRTGDSSGHGRDFTLRVERAYYQAGDQTMLHLVVEEVEERPGRREAPRFVLDDIAEASVLESSLLPSTACRCAWLIRFETASPAKSPTCKSRIAN
jgi:hypothetical protein